MDIFHVSCLWLAIYQTVAINAGEIVKTLQFLTSIWPYLQNYARYVHIQCLIPTSENIFSVLGWFCAVTECILMLLLLTVKIDKLVCAWYKLNEFVSRDADCAVVWQKALESKLAEIDENKVNLIAVVKQMSAKLKFTLKGSVARDTDYLSTALESSRERLSSVSAAVNDALHVLSASTPECPQINVCQLYCTVVCSVHVAGTKLRCWACHSQYFHQ